MKDKELMDQIVRLNQKISELEHAESARKRSDEELLASEERYRRLIEEAPFGFCLIDTSGMIQYVNKKIEEISGWMRDELVGRNGMEIGIFPEATAKILLDRLLLRLAGGKPVPDSVELPLILKDGLKTWVEMFTTINFVNEIPAGAQLVMLDITERKQAEESLQKRLAFEKLLSQISAKAIIAADLNEFLDECIAALGEAVDVCRAYIFEHRHESDTMDNTHEWCAFGVSPQKENLQGVPASATPWWIETLRSGQNISFTDIEDIPDEGSKEILRPQGILSILVVPLFANGLYWGFMGFDDCKRHRFWLEENTEILLSISRIITFVIERKKSELLLRESEGRYRLLFENTSDVIYSLDTELKVTTLSPSAEKYIGYKSEDILGKFAYELKLFLPEDAEQGLRDLTQILEKGITVSNEYRIEAKDGTLKYAEISGAPIIIDGKISGVICTARDITERKRALQERENLREQLNRAQKLESIGTLAGGIAHDFNNLLMGIQGYASLMLLEIDVLHPNYERLKRIEQQVRSGADLTSQLLGFARGGRYEVKQTDINDILEKTSTMFARTRKDIIINKNFTNPLWMVDADRTQMEQVFMNLYANSWQAMPVCGEIFLETNNMHLDDPQATSYGIKPGNYIQIKVSDTGIGMDQKTKEKLFDPFFTTKEMGRGTGLGLSTVYGIIKGHGGYIEVISEPGQGATFSIYLPATEKAAAKQNAALVNC